MAVERLGFEIMADDKGSANVSKFGKSMKSMLADVELANVRMAKATAASTAAVDKFGKDSLQAREALARLAKAEDGVETASRKLAAAQKVAADAVEESGDEAVIAVGKWDKLKTAGAAAGVGAAAAIGAGFASGLNIEAGRAKLAAQLGLTAEESASAGRIAGEVYGDALGGSMEDVNEAVRAVWSGMRQLGEQSPGQIEQATRAAMILSDTFGVDVNESVRAATRLISTGLVKDSKAAFDLMAKGFQTGGNQADDLLETLTEYSVQWRKLGLSGQDAMNLLSQGLKAGARDTDYIADAIKEFALISVSGTKQARDGFESLGLDADATAAAIAAGGDGARTAFGQVLDGLRSIADPLERERVGVELFGTKWEDLGPQVVTSLSLADNAIGNTTGTIDKMNATLGDTGAAKIESLRREMEQLVASAAGAPGVLGATAAGLAVVGPSALDAAGNLGMMVSGLKDLGVTGDRTKAVLMGVGRAAAAIAALQVASAGFGDTASAGVETATIALEEFTATGESGRDVISNLGYDLGTLDSSGLNKVGNAVASTIEGLTGMGNVFDESLTHARERIASLDAALASQVSAGNAEKAAAQFAALTREAERQGISVDDLKRGFPQYANALDGVTNQQKGTGAAVDKTSTALDKEATAFKEATAEAVSHANALLGLRGDEVSYWASVDATTQALQTNGRTLDVHTEKGRANRTALDAQARASSDYLATMQAQGEPAGRFNAQLDQSRTKLEAAAVKFGMTKAEAHAYALEMLGIPKLAPTDAKFNKAAAQAAGSQWLGFLQSVPNYVETRAVFSTAAARAERNRWVSALRSTPNSVQGTFDGWEGGGILPGPPSSRDNMLIAAASGEFVVNAEATSRNRALLERINSGQGYASGGYVSARSVAPAAMGGFAPIQLVNHGVITTTDVDEWLAERTQRLQRLGRI